MCHSRAPLAYVTAARTSCSVNGRKWLVISLGDKPSASESKITATFDPRSLNARLSSAHVRLNNDAFQKFSVRGISHSRYSTRSENRGCRSHYDGKPLSRLSPVTNLNLLVKLADEDKIILCHRDAFDWVHHVISNQVKLVQIVNQFFLVLPERWRQHLTK